MAERIRRSKEEILAEIEKKIKAHQDAISKLEARKESILNPKRKLTKAQKIKVLIDQAKEAGMSPEEIAEKLGLTIE